MAQISRYQIVTTVVGAVAVMVTFGAAQLAAGSDLKPAADETVNRAAKADRVSLPNQLQPSQTVAVQLQGQAGSSILVRIPGPIGDARSLTSPQKAPVSTRKATVACEPVVSVLTEAARVLEPGRCIT